MPVKESVRPALTEAEADGLVGAMLGVDSYDRLVTDDADLYREDGSPLLIFRRRAIPADVCRTAYPALLSAAIRPTHNRGYASGSMEGDGREVAIRLKSRWYPFKADGTVSHTKEGDPVYSRIIGYYDRTSRLPYCRTTSYNLDHPEKFGAILPLIRAVDSVFAAELPDRYAAQRAVVDRTTADFTIHGTAFSTITVNRNWQTAVHKDKGDFRDGFGVLTAVQAGEYSGGYLVLPRWRVAVDMRTCGVLLVDVHECHGNTPIVGVKGRYERLSCVFYLRDGMRYCGTTEQELAFAKGRPLGSEIVRADPSSFGKVAP